MFRGLGGFRGDTTGVEERTHRLRYSIEVLEQALDVGDTFQHMMEEEVGALQDMMPV